MQVTRVPLKTTECVCNFVNFIKSWHSLWVEEYVPDYSCYQNMLRDSDVNNIHVLLYLIETFIKKKLL